MSMINAITARPDDAGGTTNVAYASRTNQLSTSIRTLPSLLLGATFPGVCASETVTGKMTPIRATAVRSNRCVKLTRESGRV